MSFIKLSHARTGEPTAGDFFVNSDFIMRIAPKDSGSILFMHDGSTITVEQAPDTIADYVDQLQERRGVAEIKLNG